MSPLSFFVHGIPAPQGSKRHLGNGVLVESSKRVKPWRADVRETALQWVDGPFKVDRFTGPVEVSLTFYFERPRGHYGTGRNADKVRASAPEYPTSRALGDLDKLERSTLDALVSSGLLADDSLVVSMPSHKRYTGGALPPGCFIRITDLSQSNQ